jgi:hypothetical protein
MQIINSGELLMETESIDISAVINNPFLWIIALPLGCIVIFMAIMYIRLAYKNAPAAGLTVQQCNKGLRSGILSSIGPSISVFVVVFSMAAIIGGPLTWMRFSIIGAAPVDLAAINLGAETYRASVTGSEGNSLNAMATGFWTMSINSCGWLIFVFLFNHKMETVRGKIGGGDKTWLGLISISAMLGLFGFLSTPYILMMDSKAIACLGGAISMAALTFMGRKISWLKEYALGIALVMGMIAGAIFA